MGRVRSPNYPAISLADALQRVAEVFAKERQHLAPRDVVIKGMGYGGTHGASLSAFSAALKYGLIEQEGKDYRVSKRAITILHPHSPMEKADAIRDASLGPALFSELVQHFEGDLPSDDNLRSYLVRRGFSDAALGDVIRSFRETMDLVAKEAGGYSPSIPALTSPEFEKVETVTRQQPKRESKLPYETVFNRSTDEEPFRVTFLGNGRGIEIAGRIVDAASADELISAVTALKIMFKPLDTIKKPKWADKTFLPGDVVPGSTPFQAHHIGHMDGNALIEPEEGEEFPACDKCVGGPVRYTLA
jgi:hypothetical protein